MITDESISNIQRTVAHLRREDEDYEKHPAVIAAPKWWVNLVKTIYVGQMATPEDELDTIEGCAVTIKDDIDEPFAVAADGRFFPVLPGWARVANKGVTS